MVTKCQYMESGFHLFQEGGAWPRKRCHVGGQIRELSDDDDD